MDEQRPTGRRWGSALLGAMADELKTIEPRRLGIGLVSRGLPQFSFNRLRTRAMRAFGVEFGPGSAIMGPIRVTGIGDPRTLLSFGEGVVVTGPLHVDIGGRIRVGDHVYLGHDVALISVNHLIGTPGRRCADVTCAPISIGDGAWLGARVIVLPGVTIGRGSVVGAGAVVTKDVEENTLVGGSPSRLIRRLSEDWEARDCDVPRSMAPSSIRQDGS